MQLENHDIHIWSMSLDISPVQEKIALVSLSHNECERANRFHFSIHKRRFIAARCALRHIISLYLSVPPKDILFSYSEYNKPYLKWPAHSLLQFNLSHSDTMAMYAFTLNNPIGIDIEKVKNDYSARLVKRFFSSIEYERFTQLSSNDQIRGFYRLWSRKEAIIKAIGKGLSIPLSSFSVSMKDESEMITIDSQVWSLLPLRCHSDYQAAVAINRIIDPIQMKYYKFNFDLLK
jgi:4'-phosphopantetheinyl transferase